MADQILGIVTGRHGGFYQVLPTEGLNLISCRIRGNLKQNDFRDLVVVGDRVMIQKLDGDQGVITQVLQRKSILQRAKGHSEKSGKKVSREGQILIANLDQVLILLPAVEPDFHPLLLDRFLVMAEAMDLPILILIGKTDLDHDREYLQSNLGIYKNCGYPVIELSLPLRRGLEELQSCLNGKISFLMGPSGAGKSSLMNYLIPGLNLVTGEWSNRCKTGPQTTTSTSLHALPSLSMSFLADTAGFSQIFLFHIAQSTLRYCFPEIVAFNRLNPCRYADCLHRKEEDGCLLPLAVDQKAVHPDRLDRYRKLLLECAR